MMLSTATYISLWLEIRTVNFRVSRLSSNKWSARQSHSTIIEDTEVLRQAWIRGDHLETGYLKHVSNVLKSLKFRTDGGTYSDWHLLWSHEYPFITQELKELLTNLKSYQKVNKLPGSGYVTSKVSLATSEISNVPKAFKLPSEEALFREYSKSHPNAMWVQKSNNHRGISITPVSGIDLSKSGTFVQQYVDRPMIIDKRKFDIGIYTIVTSIDPLRIYIVNHELLLRFCAHDYYPFDATDRDKYVVTDDYTPIWEIPSLNKYYSQGFTAKESFHAYMKEIGLDGLKVYSAIEDTITEVYLSKISDLRDAMKPYNQRNFFEMVRFDFVLDEDANLYLMEVNMSPNLSSNHFGPNRILYEQVVYNLLHLVGLAGSVSHVSQLDDRELDMLTGPRAISADPSTCVASCSSGCLKDECKLCYPCMHSSDKTVFEDAYREHLNKRNTKRVFPPTFQTQRDADKQPDNWSTLSQSDQLMHLWFAAKCKSDSSWC